VSAECLRPRKQLARNEPNEVVKDHITSGAGLPMPPIRSEKEKMLAGELFDPLDAQLCLERDRCRDLCRRLNATREDQRAERQRLLEELFGRPTDAWIQPPFFCDYGTNIVLGTKVFFNFNCVLLDVAPIAIGSNVLFGPAVQIYAATHPIGAAERRKGLEAASPITIGSDVWVGGGAIICPGVTIGDRSVIGAGSVVTRDIPPDAFAAGNPARVVRGLQAAGER
jgi:maltose O-acetyltransferase